MKLSSSILSVVFPLLASCTFVGKDDWSALDKDGDGHMSSEYSEGDDCDDEDPDVHPGSSESCNGKDDDCDGSTDEEAIDAHPWYTDLDGDGYGDPSTSTSDCEAPTGTVSDNTDCDDSDSSEYPGATWFEDEDGDGYGAGTEIEQCEQPKGWVADGSDCDDSDPSSYPEAPELCDGLDNDCDGTEDESVDYVEWYEDFDGDGYGNAEVTTSDCAGPKGYVDNAGDCDDSNDLIHPDVEEACDGVDNDCDELIDFDDPGMTGYTTWYRDADEDGYGDSSVNTEACEQPTGYVRDFTDCDDADVGICPGAIEVVADGVDQDCDGGDTCYQDVDGDGYGTSATVNSTDLDCTGANESNLYSDCIDTDGEVNPGRKEVCDNGLDDDCDGSAGACRLYGEFGAEDSDAVVVGVAPVQSLGSEVSYAGDFNGDGYDDVFLGAPFSDGVESNSGEAFLMAGPLAGETNTGYSFLTIEGNTGSLYVGWSVAGVGDTNADGYDDVLLGVPEADATELGAGGAFLFLGPATGTIGLDAAHSTMTGEYYGGNAGYSVSAGDVNDDGFSDILVSGNEPSTGMRGNVYIMEGPLDSSVSFAYSDATIVGESDAGNADWHVAGAGDVNGDGIEDFVVGQEDARDAFGNEIGLVMVFHSPLSGHLSSSAATANIEGTVHGLGGAIAGIGDVDGDGLGDIVLGDYADSSGGAHAGAAFVVLGPAEMSGEVETIASATFVGEAAGDAFGFSASRTGDVDGDGSTDILIGAPYASSDAGTVYLAYGPPSGSLTMGSSDFCVHASGASDHLGRSVSGGGDVDGDGRPDLLMGADNEQTLSSQAGAVYVLLGLGI